MSDLNFETQLYSSGLLTDLKIKQLDYDTIEVTLKRNMKDANGKSMVDNAYTMFFTTRQFKDFFQPIVNELKVRFDNDDIKSK